MLTRLEPAAGDSKAQSRRIVAGCGQQFVMASHGDSSTTGTYASAKSILQKNIPQSRIALFRQDFENVDQFFIATLQDAGADGRRQRF